MSVVLQARELNFTLMYNVYYCGIIIHMFFMSLLTH